jgi:cytochrome c oxidase cbb3-type subunit III
MRRTLLPVLLLLCVPACERAAERAAWDRRGNDGQQAGALTAPAIVTTTLHAGTVLLPPQTRNPYADAVPEGERFYIAFNCAGCHGARGGGGIGPPLARAQYIYGNEPANIFQSIVQGRPYGMPAFGGKAPDEVIWKIAAYVRYMSQPGSPHPPDPAADTEASEGSP